MDSHRGQYQRCHITDGLRCDYFLLLFLIARWKWHVFFALLSRSCSLASCQNQQNNFIDAFENGFGNTWARLVL